MELIKSMSAGGDTLFAGGIHDVVTLLRSLISTPSPSGKEDKTVCLIQSYMRERGITVNIHNNNIWAFNAWFDPEKPTILLLSHHDKPDGAPHWNPKRFYADIFDGKIYGLGSNDAGGSLVSLLKVFEHYYNQSNLLFNLCFATVAEEENSGSRGLTSILPRLKAIDFAIVGAPTGMQMATAEMGHMLLKCTCFANAVHAAHKGGNAITGAVEDISWFTNFRFPVTPAFMPAVNMTVTSVNAGRQHNSTPEQCEFTVDVRLNDCYTPDQILEIIACNTHCKVDVCQKIIKPSQIDNMHPMVTAGRYIGLTTCVSNMTSDWGLLGIPALKLGPGDPRRSHTADEYIFVSEIEEAITLYINLLDALPATLINKLLKGPVSRYE